MTAQRHIPIDAERWVSQGAEFSGCFLYRYRLWREWNPKLPICTFIMLNPSTANAQKTDPTVRRCIGFARKWSYGRLEVVNAFAWIATDPNELKNAQPDAREFFRGAARDAFGGVQILVNGPKDPVGPENDVAIHSAVVQALASGGCVVAAWNGMVEKLGRLPRMLEILEPFKSHIYTLGYTEDGTPKHPLYLPAATERLAFVHPMWFNLGLRRAHCGRDPAAVGCCGGTDATCSCECNICQDPNG